MYLSIIDSRLTDRIIEILIPTILNLLLHQITLASIVLLQTEIRILHMIFILLIQMIIINHQEMNVQLVVLALQTINVVVVSLFVYSLLLVVSQYLLL
mgnify:FL=1